MNQIELQTALKLRGNYHYKLDGIPGLQHRAAIMQAVTEGADRKLSDDVIKLIARGNDLPPSRIYAVRAVEASGAGFDASTGAAIILPEPHRFSRTTGGRFDKSNPTLSYPNWDRTKYPKTQQARWNQLVDMIVLDPDAGFMSASHGLFQIMGENYAVCGFKTPFDFVMAMSLSEDAQIEAFLAFITNKRVRGASLLTHLRNGEWDSFALGYNGTAFRENKYDTKLRDADARYQGFN